jgi:hypothetical protein
MSRTQPRQIYRYIADMREHPRHFLSPRFQISTAWDGADGMGGMFERMFVPRLMSATYADELRRLDADALTPLRVSRSS